MRTMQSYSEFGVTGIIIYYQADETRCRSDLLSFIMLARVGGTIFTLPLIVIYAVLLELEILLFCNVSSLIKVL